MKTVIRIGNRVKQTARGELEQISAMEIDATAERIQIRAGKWRGPPWTLRRFHLKMGSHHDTSQCFFSNGDAENRRRNYMGVVRNVITLSLILFSANVHASTLTQKADVYIPPDVGPFYDIGSGWKCVQRWYGGGSRDSGTDTPDPSSALEFFWPAGTLDGYEPMTCWNKFSASVSEFWVQYYFKYSGNWDWHPVNSKHWYAQSNASSQRYRLIAGVGGNQHYRVSTSVQSPLGAANYFSNTGYEPTIERNQWYKVNLHFNFGNPGVANGSWQVWINDRLVQNYSGFMLLSSSDVGINEFDITPVWGGSMGIYTSNDMSVWFDQITVSTDGPISGIQIGGSKVPNPPKFLSIQ